ncbi:MAG: GPW/gp25 family protein [Gammaproteobacteria bacterium]|nr:GPW/gp25 family protein [Gammaproteobacteria bacterium]
MTNNFRALYFHHPDFDTEPVLSGLQITPTGRLKWVDEDLSVRQAILLLLTTTKGERVMRQDYGCDLDQLVFMPTDETTLGLAIHLVRQALSRWEPRIEIRRLDAAYNSKEPYRMDIILEYNVRRSAGINRLTIPMSMT